jgi:hypothetical protein
MVGSGVFVRASGRPVDRPMARPGWFGDMLDKVEKEPLVFRAVWWRRLDVIGLILLFSSLLIANLWFVSREGASAASLFMMPLWIVLVAGIVYILLVETIEVEFLDGSVVFKSLVRERTLQDDEIQLVEDKVAGEDSYLEVYAVSGESFGMSIRAFDRSVQLTRLLKARCSGTLAAMVESALQNGRTFGSNKLIWLVHGVALLISVMGGLLVVVDGDRVVRFIGAGVVVFGAMIWLLASLARKTGVRVDHAGITFKQFVGTREIRWNELTRVKLSSPRVEHTRREWIELRSIDTTINLMDMRDDFALLREVILTSAPAHVVVDERRRDP